MVQLSLADTHTPPVRVMALHALAYCPRLFYLEAVEEIRVANAWVYAGRELHAALAAEDEGEMTQLELTSDKLGLTGKVDCLKRRDGSYLPYEIKRGQPRRDKGQPASAWPSVRLQVIAYAVLLEEAFCRPMIPMSVYCSLDTTRRLRLAAASLQVRLQKEIP